MITVIHYICNLRISILVIDNIGGIGSQILKHLLPTLLPATTPVMNYIHPHSECHADQLQVMELQTAGNRAHASLGFPAKSPQQLPLSARCRRPCLQANTVKSRQDAKKGYKEYRIVPFSSFRARGNSTSVRTTLAMALAP